MFSCKHWRLCNSFLSHVQLEQPVSFYIRWRETLRFWCFNPLQSEDLALFWYVLPMHIKCHEYNCLNALNYNLLHYKSSALWLLSLWLTFCSRVTPLPFLLVSSREGHRGRESSHLSGLQTHRWGVCLPERERGWRGRTGHDQWRCGQARGSVHC